MANRRITITPTTTYEDVYNELTKAPKGSTVTFDMQEGITPDMVDFILSISQTVSGRTVRWLGSLTPRPRHKPTPTDKPKT